MSISEGRIISPKGTLVVIGHCFAKLLNLFLSTNVMRWKITLHVLNGLAFGGIDWNRNLWGMNLIEVVMFSVPFHEWTIEFLHENANGNCCGLKFTPVIDAVLKGDIVFWCQTFLNVMSHSCG